MDVAGSGLRESKPGMIVLVRSSAIEAKNMGGAHSNRFRNRKTKLIFLVKTSEKMCGVFEAAFRFLVVFGGFMMVYGLFERTFKPASC